MDRKEARRKAQELVMKMTIEEKASQLRYDSPGISRLGIPEYNWWNEGLHGVARAGIATVFPQAIGMAASFDEDMVRKIGDIIAEEGRAKYNAASKQDDRDIYKGLTFWAPNVNIFRDPRWGRGHETYGEDPCLTATLGKAYVEGLQGNGETMKAAACAKHFAVHSGPEALRHEFNAEVSQKDMEETYLPAFKALVEDAHVEAVMGAYNCVNGEPCCGSKTLIKNKLRGEWNFEGHFVSDCWAIRDFHENHMVTGTPMQSAAMALNAGCDLNCGNTYLHILNAYHHGMVTEEAITEAAVRLFTTRFMLGLFDGSEYDKIPYSKVECSEHLLIAHKAALESIVLLKNENGILPLKEKEIKTLGIIGPNADSRAALIGNYHGTSSEYVTVLEGVRRYVGDEIRIIYSQGCDLFKNKTEPLAQDMDRLSEAVTVAPATVGLPTTASLSFTRRTLSNVTVSPSATPNFSTLIMSPSDTLYCFPPVAIIAYILASSYYQYSPTMVIPKDTYNLVVRHTRLIYNRNPDLSTVFCKIFSQRSANFLSCDFHKTKLCIIHVFAFYNIFFQLRA